MLYVSMLMLPFVLYGYLAASPPKTVVAAKADPGAQLKGKKISVRRELRSAIFLGASIAFVVAIIIFLGGLVVDYKNSQGLFALPLPNATFPPAPTAQLPPAPN